MVSKTRKNKLIAFWLAMFSSLFLFLSGTTGVTSWMKIQEIVSKYITSHLINILFIIIFIIASFGFISVLLGGFLILKNKKFWGKVLINIGTGVGIIGFLFNLFIAIITSTFSIYSYVSFSSIGILLAVFSQYYASKN